MKVTTPRILLAAVVAAGLGAAASVWFDGGRVLLRTETGQRVLQSAADASAPKPPASVIPAKRGDAMPPVEHALTHFDWQLEPWRHELPAHLEPARSAASEAALPPGRWVERADALALGLPAPVRKMLVAY